MKASESQLLRFMSGSKQRFDIPIFQRTYSWDREQCKQLWEDVVLVASDDRTHHHFIGSIIYIHEGLFQVTTTQRMLIIDGQQRLTTVSLFLLALAKADETLRDEIYDEYILNKRQLDETRFKLGLTRGDKETFYSLVDNRDAPLNASANILDNFKYFEEQIAKTELNAQELYKGIHKLIIVDVSLDRASDDPQRIFESLNSTGISLFESDKIRNFVLLNLSPKDQASLYNRHWYPMEQRFEQSGLPKRAIDVFLKNYVTAKTEITPKQESVYMDFKRHVVSEKRSPADVVEELKAFSAYDMYWYFPETFKDHYVSEMLGDLNSLDVDVAWPMLLNLFDDFERRDLLSLSDLREILQMVEVYVFRRGIVGIPTNSLKTTFASFLGQVDKNNNYLESFKDTFLNRSWFRRFPDDQEFREAFINRPLYREMSKRLPYLLTKLENHERREQINSSDFTMEHVLPQGDNLRREWQESLGVNWRELRFKYVHTIGNLTFTAYNSELSDRPFAEKRNMDGGFASSPLWLNSDLGQLENWSEEAILARANRLFDRALEIWPYPQLDD